MKAKHRHIASVPTLRPLYSAPRECAPSSMTTKPYSSAISMIISMSAGCPVKSTGIIAFVFGVICLRISLGSMLYVRSLISANTGFPPQ